LEFLEYIKKLAPAGETALIVRQKQQLKGGELQYHADGAMKCTWPAYLPSHSMRTGEAWYGNTASFILDRFKDGRVSASAACCDYVLVMMLDDIGTKSKTPPLAPTWIIETSPGSFQWGYAFADQPTKAEFAAAIRAIADAGYTDPGACNPVRNFRLPGSVNLKPGRDNFTARLVEFHPEREFSLPDICAALNVTPVPMESLELRPIRISDDGADDGKALGGELVQRILVRVPEVVGAGDGSVLEDGLGFKVYAVTGEVPAAIGYLVALAESNVVVCLAGLIALDVIVRGLVGEYFKNHCRC
jgi:hypothetical protein